MLTSLFEKTATHKSDATESVVRSMVSRAPGGVVQMPPGIADRILQELNFPNQRTLDESRVYEAHRNIITGDWLEGHAVTLVVLPNGVMWLVDGQHRLTAISRCRAPVPVTVRIVPMDSEKDARHFYAGFDKKSSVRTTAQVLDAYDIAAQVGMSRRMTNSVFDAAPLLMNKLEPLTGSASVKKNPAMFASSNRTAIIQEWAAEGRAFEQIIGRSKTALRAKLRSTGIVAVAMYTLRYQPAKAQEFWTGLAENDGLRKNDPRATLITDLLTRGLNSGSIRQRVQQPALAWNAWCEGRDLKIIKCITDSPITLWGTPLNGKQDK